MTNKEAKVHITDNINGNMNKEYKIETGVDKLERLLEKVFSTSVDDILNCLAMTNEELEDDK